LIFFQFGVKQSSIGKLQVYIMYVP
jgi:hypothetical protein